MGRARFSILSIVAGCVATTFIYRWWVITNMIEGYQSNIPGIDINEVLNKKVVQAAEMESKTKCPDGWTYFEDVDIRNRSSAESTDQLIPKVLYQTSKSRCMHSDIAPLMNAWRSPDFLPGYSFLLHDDEAMDNFLFDKERWESTFPSLHLALKCIDKIHNPTIKADIWRYLVLWEYGGMYADLDFIPRIGEGFNHLIHPDDDPFTHHSIHPDDDGLFYTRGGGEDEDFEAKGFLAQMFLIASPHHPLMYYAVHAAVRNLLNVKDIIRVDPALTSGPRALLNAMELFMNNKTAGRGIQNGTHVGEGGRSIRVEHHIDYFFDPDGIGHTPRKKRIYKEMNMTHFHQLKHRDSRGFRGCYDIMNATKTKTGFKYEGMTVELLEIPPI